MRKINEVEVRFLTRVRTAIEIDLAKNMYALFNDEPIIGVLREGVGHVLGLLSYDIDYSSSAYTNEAKNLVVFKKFGGGQKGELAMARVRSAINSWSASDCSDLIRLIATLIEKGGQGFTKKGKGSHEVRAGNEFLDKLKPGGTFNNVPGNPATPGWTGRSRIGANKVGETPGFSRAPRHITAGRRQIDVERMVLHAPEGRGKAFYGIKPYMLMPHSTVRKIDIAFGLPQGADISGTTADSIVVFKQIALFTRVLEEASDKKLPEAVLQLLPLATMVALGHHTLVESALTLTLSKFINYSIGFYSTLMPNPHDRRGIDDEVSARLMRALRNAESSHGNTHFICYYNGEKYEGLTFDSPEEKERFKKFAWLADPFREEIGSLSPIIPKDQLLSILDGLEKRRIEY